MTVNTTADANVSLTGFGLTANLGNETITADANINS
jgi:hypothetical protein